MAFKATVTEQISEGGNVIANTKEYTGEGRDSRSIAVPDGTTDLLVAAAVDLSQIQMIWLSCDQDLTVETNDGTTPADTISLLAGRALIWHPASYMANPFTVDVTDLYLTNTSGKAATFEMVLLLDATP